MDAEEKIVETPLAEKDKAVGRVRREPLAPAKWFNFDVPQKEVHPLFITLCRLVISVFIMILAAVLLFQGEALRTVGISFISLVATYWFGIKKSN